MISLRLPQAGANRGGRLMDQTGRAVTEDELAGIVRADHEAGIEAEVITSPNARRLLGMTQAAADSVQNFSSDRFDKDRAVVEGKTGFRISQQRFTKVAAAADQAHISGEVSVEPLGSRVSQVLAIRAQEFGAQNRPKGDHLFLIYPTAVAAVLRRRLAISRGIYAVEGFKDLKSISPLGCLCFDVIALYIQ